MRAVAPVIGIGLLLVAAPAGAQVPEGGPAAAQAPSGARRPPPRSAAEADLPVLEMTLDPELERTKAQVESLRQVVQSVLVPMGVLVGVLAGGALLAGAAGSAGVLVLLRRERRAAAAIAAVPAVPAGPAPPAEEIRSAREILDATHRILGLVQETLQLAKDAGERATRAAGARMGARVAELEGRARAALEAAGGPDASADRAPLAAIAAEAETLEPHLALADGELPAACLLATGLARSWRGDLDAGLERVRAAARRAADPELTALAHAATGAALLDLGRFGEAGEALRRALAAAPAGTLRHAELERRRLECALHEIADDATDDAVEGLDRGLDRLADGLEAASAPAAVRQQVAATRGDALAWAARRASTPDRGRALHERAVAAFRQAGQTAWARSGLLEARHALGEPIGLEEGREVLARVDAELGAAGSPGAVATLLAVRVLVQARLDVPPAEREADYRELRHVLRDVAPAVTLASPWERRRVGRAVLEAEARTLAHPADERRDAAGDGAGRAEGASPEGPPRLAKAGARGPTARAAARRGLSG
jgi:tetratricopeptide (TPR) repeat protein